MKKKEKIRDSDEIEESYDFSTGVQGKHYKSYRKGHTVKINKKDGSIETHYFTSEEGSIMLDPDVKKHFTDSETVNKILREYITTH